MLIIVDAHSGVPVYRQLMDQVKFHVEDTLKAGDGICDAAAVEVMVAEGDSFVPIDPAKVYGVVTNDYMRNGGDGYRMFRDGMNPYDFGPGLEVVLADFIAAMGGTYTPFTDGRITKVE